MLSAVLLSFAEEGVDAPFFLLDLSLVPHAAVATPTRRKHVTRSRGACRKVARLDDGCGFWFGERFRLSCVCFVPRDMANVYNTERRIRYPMRPRESKEVIE